MDFSNFNSLLNPENFVELNSITTARLVLQLFVGVKNYESKLCIYVFATGVSCEITYRGSTELSNVPYISSKVRCMISFCDQETWILRLNIWMLNSWG